MIEETVQVRAIEGDRLLLEARPRSACGGCAARGGCGTSMLASVLGRRPIRFSLPNTVDAREGDWLLVGLPENALLGGSLLVYLLPLLGLIAGGLLADALLPASHGRDLLIALAAFVVMGVTLLAGRRWLVSGQVCGHAADQARSQGRGYTPVILRKLPASDRA